MKKAKVIVEWNILDKIANSTKLTEREKISYLRYVWYLTQKEKRNLTLVI